MSAVHCCATLCEDAHQKQSKMAQKDSCCYSIFCPRTDMCFVQSAQEWHWHQMEMGL